MLELQVLHGLAVERLHHARGQAVPAGKDDALVVGEPAAGPSDAVESDDGPGEGVEDEMTLGVLLVRAHAQQDQGARAGVRDVRVGEGLQRLLDRLLVHAPVGLRVVLGFHGEAAADRRDEDVAADGDVRMTSENVVVTGGLHPDHVVRGWEDVVPFPTGIQEPCPPVRGEFPAQNTEVLSLLPCPEDGQHLAVDRTQPVKSRALEVAAQGRELPYEVGVVEQAGDGILRQSVQVTVVQ